MRGLLLICAMLTGCDDYVFRPSAGGGEAIEGDGWCAVQSVFATQCVGCHRGADAPGDLDLLSDPHTALVGQASSAEPGLALVEPGSPELSFLLAKLEGTLVEGQGGPMPPGRSLDAELIDVVRAWIVAGADSVCDGPVADPTDGVHPDGFAEPGVHGPVAKLQELECVECHGADLTGDVGPSCDTCHDDGWRSNCTFCHGGENDTTGAPPRLAVSTPQTSSFDPHAAHVQDTAWHDGFDCSTCHDKPTNVLSVGHIFVGDDTPGVAEVNFAGGLSDAARFSAGTCSNAYCHGDRGRDNGTVTHTASVDRCSSCHPDATSGRDAWDDRMSGEHEDHLREGLACSDCHGATTTDGRSIANPALHVNGVVDLALPGTISRTGLTCNGSCHGESHNDRDWD